MTIDHRWIYATAALATGFLVGAVLANVARRVLGDPARRGSIQAVARPTSTFLFWLSVATGVVTGIGFTSPQTLEPIPSDILAWLPRALAAGLIILAGYAGGVTISAAIAATVERAVGQRPAMVERAIRIGVMAAAIVLALGNLGVETTSLQILIAGVVFSLGLTLALVAGLGGQRVANNVASGRALARDLALGDRLRIGEIEGTVAVIRPTVLLLDTGDATTVVPFSMLLEQPFKILRATPP